MRGSANVHAHGSTPTATTIVIVAREISALWVITYPSISGSASKTRSALVTPGSTSRSNGRFRRAGSADAAPRCPSSLNTHSVAATPATIELIDAQYAGIRNVPTADVHTLDAHRCTSCSLSVSCSSVSNASAALAATMTSLRSIRSAGRARPARRFNFHHLSNFVVQARAVDEQSLQTSAS